MLTGLDLTCVCCEDEAVNDSMVLVEAVEEVKE